MKIVAMIAVLFLAVKVTKGQEIQDIKVFYYDDQTEKGKKVYREFKYIGDEPYFSKPETLDVVVSFNKNLSLYTENDIQIFIEELYQPTSLAKNPGWPMSQKRWVPHSVIFSGNSSFIKSHKITVKNYPYQTAYYISNLLYLKLGFRVMVIYHDKTRKKVTRLMKAFYIPND